MAVLAGIACGKSASDAPPAAAPAPATAKAAAALLGEWGTPGDPGNLIFKADGTFVWGLTVRGTYKVLDDKNVRMAFVHDNRPSGQMDSRFTVMGDLISLTAPDGVMTTYKRVK
jgi:hypothetical protein